MLAALCQVSMDDAESPHLAASASVRRPRSWLWWRESCGRWRWWWCGAAHVRQWSAPQCSERRRRIYTRLMLDGACCG